MKSSVIVTLADSGYITQAKQLFSSVYFNAGWKGDYLLLAHGVSDNDRAWFKKRGIQIKKCKPLFRKKVGRYSSVLTSKLYLFTEEMKQWKKVIYLDADIIVRASLDHLLEQQGYAVVPEIDGKRLADQFLIKNASDKEKLREILAQLGDGFDLNSLSFNAGVIVFSTDIIKPETFSKMIKLMGAVGEIGAYGDQATQNLYFYHIWKRLPRAYNISPDFLTDCFRIKEENMKGIILHFIAVGKKRKPWHHNNYFYEEWKENLEKSSSIDTSKAQEAREVWSKARIWRYEKYFEVKYFLHYNNSEKTSQPEW